MRTKKAQRDDLVFVTGYWLRQNEREMSLWDKNALVKSLRLLRPEKLIVFYKDPCVIDFVRHEAFELNIQLIGVFIDFPQMPFFDELDGLIKRVKLYGVSQNSSVTLPDHMDKGWTLYWTQYLRWGEQSFRQSLCSKLSKTGLMADLAPEAASFGGEHFVWMDHDIGKWFYSKDDAKFLRDTSFAQNIQHFESYYYYLGRRLEVGGHCLSGHVDEWKHLDHAFHQQVDRLQDFPYPYDDEVLLTLTRAQKPEIFSQFGQDWQHDCMSKTGT